jgi:hypothetical protein
MTLVSLKLWDSLRELSKTVLASHVAGLPDVKVQGRYGTLGF